MSQKITAAITGVNGWVPEFRLTNQILETMVETNDEWIRSRTGISERRLLKDPDKGTSEIGYQAVTGLLEKTGTKPEEIDMLICATITPDMTFPDTANTICDKCGLVNAWGYDLGAACSGFLFAYTTAAKFIESGYCKKVIVVGADKMSSIIDYTDRTTCVIFGDGGGAVLLEPNTEGLGLQDAILKGDGSGRQHLHMKAGGSLKPPTVETIEAREHYVYQEGRHVFKNAVRGMSGVTRDLLKRNGLKKEDINWLVPHQANMRIIESVSGQLDFPLEKVMINIQRYGNTTAGTLPLCLHDYEPQLKKGDKIILTAFGGGFTWGSIYLTWAYDS
ncbi:MAG: beta-ketoacyl-ACP synthase III [Bacteroidota bacterium]